MSWTRLIHSRRRRSFRPRLIMVMEDTEEDMKNQMKTTSIKPPLLTTMEDTITIPALKKATRAASIKDMALNIVTREVMVRKGVTKLPIAMVMSTAMLREAKENIVVVMAMEVTVVEVTKEASATMTTTMMRMMNTREAIVITMKDMAAPQMTEEVTIMTSKFIMTTDTTMTMTKETIMVARVGDIPQKEKNKTTMKIMMGATVLTVGGSPLRLPPMVPPITPLSTTGRIKETSKVGMSIDNQYKSNLNKINRFSITGNSLHSLFIKLSPHHLLFILLLFSYCFK